MDFIRLVPEEHLSKHTFELVIALLNSSSIKKNFYDGRTPSYSDVNLLLSKMKLLQESEQLDEQEWKELIDVVRFVLQKTITAPK